MSSHLKLSRFLFVVRCSSGSGFVIKDVVSLMSHVRVWIFLQKNSSHALARRQRSSLLILAQGVHDNKKFHRVSCTMLGQTTCPYWDRFFYSCDKGEGFYRSPLYLQNHLRYGYKNYTVIALTVFKLFDFFAMVGGGGGAQNASRPPFWLRLSCIFLVKSIQTLINWEWAQSRSEVGTPSIPRLVCYWYAFIYIQPAGNSQRHFEWHWYPASTFLSVKKRTRIPSLTYLTKSPLSSY